MFCKKQLFTFLFLVMGTVSCCAMNSESLVGRCITAYVNHVESIVKRGIEYRQPTATILNIIKDTVPQPSEGCITSIPIDLMEDIRNAMVFAWAKKRYSTTSQYKTILFYDGRMIASSELLNPATKIKSRGENSRWAALPFEELYKKYIRVKRAHKNKQPYPNKITKSEQAESNRTASPNTEGSIQFLLPL